MRAHQIKAHSRLHCVFLLEQISWLCETTWYQRTQCQIKQQKGQSSEKTRKLIVAESAVPLSPSPPVTHFTNEKEILHVCNSDVQATFLVLTTSILQVREGTSERTGYTSTGGKQDHHPTR